MFQLLKLFLNRKARLALTVPEFAEANKDLLIIVCDPKEDTITVSYKKWHVNGKIKSASGKNPNVVKQVLKHSQFHTSIDDFLVAVAETLHINMKVGNQFLQFLDGALFNISDRVSGKKKEVPPEKVEPAKMAGAIKSPYVSQV